MHHRQSDDLFKHNSKSFLQNRKKQFAKFNIHFKWLNQSAYLCNVERPRIFPILFWHCEIAQIELHFFPGISSFFLLLLPDFTPSNISKKKKTHTQKHGRISGRHQQIFITQFLLHFLFCNDIALFAFAKPNKGADKSIYIVIRIRIRVIYIFISFIDEYIRLPSPKRIQFQSNFIQTFRFSTFFCILSLSEYDI